MPVKISTISSFDEATDVVVRAWQEAGRPKLLRFDGFDGVGKSGLARLVAPRIGAEHVEGDKFTSRPSASKPYWECAKAEDFAAAISGAVASRNPVILDAVCLGVVAPISLWGRGLLVYLKRL